MSGLSGVELDTSGAWCILLSGQMTDIEAKNVAGVFESNDESIEISLACKSVNALPVGNRDRVAATSIDISYARIGS